jgi:hypothetical protein
VTAVHKKIVIDEHGQPLEVIIPWAQFCEMSEALGLDLDPEAEGDLRQARRDWECGARTEFIPLNDL